MLAAPPRARPLTGAARHATRLLSHTAKKRQEAAIRAVEQLRWLQQTRRPLKLRLWSAAVQQLEQHVTALRVSVHFPHLLAAAAVLSQERPLKHEDVLLQILLHHVLQRPAEAAAAVDGCSVDRDCAAAASRTAAAAAQKESRMQADAAAAGVALAETAQLTDQQFLQLLLCWDNAAALRPRLETLAQPLLRSLVCRAAQRSGQLQQELFQEWPIRLGAGLVLADDQAAQLQLGNSTTDCCCSSGDSGTAFVSSENKNSKEERYSAVNAQALSTNGRPIWAACESGGKTAARVNPEQPAAAAAAAAAAAVQQLSEELQLLKFLGRRLDALLLLLEQERPAASITEAAKPSAEAQHPARCRHRAADGIRRASANSNNNTGAAAAPGASYGGASSHTEGDSSGYDSTQEEEAAAYFRLREQLRTASPKELPRRRAVGRAEAEAAAAGCSRIVCATWRLLLHCHNAWRGYGKRFGWKEGHAAAVLPELTLSGARVLLALLQHLQTVEALRERMEQQATEAATDGLVLLRSETKQRQQQPPKHLGCQVLQGDCQLQQPSSSTVMQSRATEGRTVLDEENFAGRLAPALHCRRRWSGCSTEEGAGCSPENCPAACFQVQDLQRLAENFQRQLLQLPLQCLSHSQALVQLPAAACLLRLVHQVSSYVKSKRCNKLQEKVVVSESGGRRPKLRQTEAQDGRQQQQQQQKQERGGPTKTEQDAWRSLSLSVDQHIRKERGRREAAALQVEDVCDCLNAVLRCRWIPTRTVGRLLRAACNQTDDLSPEQRADLNTALSQLSAVMKQMHRFIQGPAAIDRNNVALTPKNPRCGLRGSDIQSSGCSSICCWGDCLGTPAIHVSGIPHAQSSGDVVQMIELEESVGNREGMIWGMQSFERGLQKSDARSKFVHVCPPAIMRKDEDNRLQSMGSGWVAAVDAMDNFEDKVVPFFTCNRIGSTRQETNGQMELTILLDFINCVNWRKILQRRHRSLISWKSGRRDARARTF